MVNAASNLAARCGACQPYFDAANQSWRHQPNCPVMLQAQGEPLTRASSEDIEILAVPELPKTLEDAIAEAKRALSAVLGMAQARTNPETNFNFYVDGFTIGLSGPDETTCQITHPDGRTMPLKRKSLTDFFERRFGPAESDGNLTPG